jgi:hypothetical protein
LAPPEVIDAVSALPGVSDTPLGDPDGNGIEKLTVATAAFPEAAALISTFALPPCAPKIDPELVGVVPAPRGDLHVRLRTDRPNAKVDRVRV